jgi:LemA protein
LIYSIYLYNTIVSAKNKVDETLSAIDVMLKNRFDMIPNLVATVKEYMNHETKLLNDLTEKRTAVINGTTQEKVDVDNMFTSAFRTIFANAEAYPDLKSSANFISLQKEISSIENKLQATRRTYNAAVKRIHDLKLQVPTNMLA